MIKTIFILTFLALSFSAQAMQSKQEIIDYCTKSMLSIGGNYLVMRCIEMELDAQKKVEELNKDIK